jgi:DNA polymerase-3 subunit gamma/tau
MEYQVLARKWRPRKFSEVIGQEHVTKTLQNEITRERTAHAYLLVGPRGIGKTTIARIFAKALNCRKYPAAEPCCECDNCVAVQNGASLDIIEIDGASNNTVDNVRNLREEVHYSPVSGKFKIYIVDEVHMLSAGAWNAFLKTVEEPPAHVKFIFATTEAHKVLPTIISRCQRFDLRRIPTLLIAQMLAKIAKEEKVGISSEALDALARAADGGMRDAQSLLDQMIAFRSSENDEISEQDILSVFGLAARDQIGEIVSAVIENNPSSLISHLNSIASQGKNLEKLYDEILSTLRGVQISKIEKNAEDILEENKEAVDSFRKLGEKCDLEKIQRILETLSSSARSLHDALNKHIFIETILLKAMRISNSVRIEQLIEKINELYNTASPDDDEVKKKAPEQPSRQITQTINYPAHSQTPPQIAKIAEPKPHTFSYEKKTPRTPEELLRLLIDDIKHTKPAVKSSLQKGVPESFDKNILTISMNEEYEDIHYRQLLSETELLNNSLKRLSGIRDVSVRIVKKNEISSPHETAIYHNDRNLETLKQKALQNSFIKEITGAFNGKIIDIIGGE